MGRIRFNVYFLPPEKELVTPSLESGLILPGITRYSLLDLARQWVSLRHFT